MQTTLCAWPAHAVSFTYTKLQDWAGHGLGKHRSSLCVSQRQCLGGTQSCTRVCAVACLHGESWVLSAWVATGVTGFQLNRSSCALGTVCTCALTWEVQAGDVGVGVAAAAQKLRVHVLVLESRQRLPVWLLCACILQVWPQLGKGGASGPGLLVDACGCLWMTQAVHSHCRFGPGAEFNQQPTCRHLTMWHCKQSNPAAMGQPISGPCLPRPHFTERPAS
jgi:hypothetical protein